MHPRIEQYRTQLGALKRGEVVPPKQVTAALCYGCNFHCPGCCSGAENRRGWRFVDSDILLSLLDEAMAMGSLRSLQIGGGGEPLFHPEIHRILDGAYQRGLAVGILTNGTRLTADEALRTQLFEGNKYVRISLYRETDIESVIRLAHFPRRAKLGAKILVNRRNLAFCERVLKNLRGVPFDYVGMKAERNSPDELTDEPDETIANIERVLRQANPALEGSLAKTRTQHRCYLTPMQVYIDPMCDLYLCCLYHGREDSFRIGSLRDQRSFRAIWEGAAHKVARSRVDMRDCNQWDCRWFGYLEQAEAALNGRSIPDGVSSQDDLEFV